MTSAFRHPVSQSGTGPRTAGWFSCHGYPVPAVPSLLSCSGHPLLSVPYRLTCPAWPLTANFPDWPVPGVLSWLSYPVALLWMSYPGCSDLTLMFWQSSCPLIYVLFFRPHLHLNCPVRAVLFRLSCPSITVPSSPFSAVLLAVMFGRPVLSQLSCLRCPLLLSCSGCPTQAVLLLLSYPDCPGLSLHGCPAQMYKGSMIYERKQIFSNSLRISVDPWLSQIKKINLIR